jgi:hypothetical protein
VVLRALRATPHHYPLYHGDSQRSLILLALTGGISAKLTDSGGQKVKQITAYQPNDAADPEQDAKGWHFRVVQDPENTAQDYLSRLRATEQLDHKVPENQFKA